MWNRSLFLVVLLAASVHGQGPPAAAFFPREVGDPSITPAACAAIVHGDLAAMAPGERYHARYLYLPHLNPKDRLTFARVLAGHCNSLSREPELKAPVPVDADAAVLRVDLRWYGWDAKVWEKLQDPYSTYEVQKKVPWEGGVWPGDGKYYEKGFFQVLHTFPAPGPWLAVVPSSPAMVAEIATWTGSGAPMVRGDWFLSQTATQEGKVPGYYDFLGVKNEADFRKLVRFDPKLGEKTEHVRVAVFSGITLQPRRMQRTNSVLGGYWETFDSEKAVGLKDPVVVLDDKFQFDITEKFAPLLNGLPAWYLGDNKGGRADKALDNIVGGDRFGASNDTRLAINLSCIRCHYAAMHENGVKDLSALGIKRLADPDYEFLQKLTRQYLRDVAEPMEADRLGYLRAVKRATGGWEPAEYGREYQRAWSGYEDAKIDLRQAARQLGVPTEELGVKLAGYDLASGGKLNPWLGILRDGGQVPIRQWEAVWPTINEVYHGTKVVLKEGKK